MSKLMSSVKKAPGSYSSFKRVVFGAPSTPPPEPVMPDDVEQQRRARLDAAKRAKRGGRASTILAEPPGDIYGS